MPELSNLLRQRLAGTETGSAQVHPQATVHPEASVHPDADTLTAYTEQSLHATERQTVVAHLSVCEPCREVVALSQSPLPESEVQTVLKPAPVSAWRRLLTPAFGLGAAVAAMAIIAVLVLQLPQKHPQQASNQQASNQQPSNQQFSNQPAPETQSANAALTGDQVSQAAASAPLPSGATKMNSRSAAGLDGAIAAKEAQRMQKRDEAARGTVAGQAALGLAPPATSPARTTILAASAQKKDYINTNFFANGTDNVMLDGQSNNLPAAPRPQPGTGGAFSTSNSKITMFADLPANAAGKSNVRILTPTPPAEHSSCTVCKIVGAGVHSLHLHPSGLAPAFRSSTLGTSAIGGQGMFSSTLAKNQPVEASAAPAKGEASGLAASDALSPGAMSVSGARSSSPTWKVVGGKLLKSSDQSQWEDAYPPAGFEFSFVSARGHDVWAGGSHASVIHSRDGGVTWENVSLGDAATGTVLSIIAGSASVQVKTSDNQVWSSSDGGKTWTITNE
jgi:hypothetical protein